jgi:hypothetical protein
MAAALVRADRAARRWTLAVSMQRVEREVRQRTRVAVRAAAGPSMHGPTPAAPEREARVEAVERAAQREQAEAGEQVV